MSIKCGRCHQMHETVSEVRDCYNGGSPSAKPFGTPSSARATDKQARFLASLMSQEGVVFKDNHAIEDTDKRDASVLIDNLKAIRAARAYGKAVPHLHPDFLRVREVQVQVSANKKAALPDVPGGHYATRSLTGNNDYDFWRVDRPKEGRWAGYTFVKRVIGGKPDAAVRGHTAREALEAIISEGTEKCGFRYAQEIGRCRRCNRHLTVEASRHRGYGPECWQKVGGVRPVMTGSAEDIEEQERLGAFLYEHDSAVMAQAGRPQWRSGKIKRCPECGAVRNQYHKDECSLGEPNAGWPPASSEDM